MPQVWTKPLICKKAEKPRVRIYRISWPTDRALGAEPISRVFRLSMCDAALKRWRWRQIDTCDRRDRAEVAAGQDLGRKIRVSEWTDTRPSVQTRGKGGVQ